MGAAGVWKRRRRAQVRSPRANWNAREMEGAGVTRYNMILLLVAAMIGSGVLGGAANFLILHKDDPEYAKRSRSIVLGLVASLLVPILLKTIASDMIDKISNIRYGSGVPFDFFVFTSLCLLAAVLSRTVVETVAKRLSAEVKKQSRMSLLPGEASLNRCFDRKWSSGRNPCPNRRGIAFPLAFFRTFPSIIPTGNF